MKFKKSILILILAVFLLSIAGACASDVNDTAAASQDSTTVELTHIDESEDISTADESQVVGQTDNPEIMGANEKGTFTELKNEIQNGYNSNITLGRDYEYDGSGTEGIKITQSITIDGNGSTIDAKGESVIFDIRGGTVVIKNITFKNAHVPNAPPGAIRLDGVNFTISDCVFIGNSAYRFGGAIYAIDSTCTISDCVFLRNSVSYGPGGAICSLGPCTIRGCVFEDNSAQGGGAIYGGDSNIISDCVFVNNHISGSNGGAILFERGYCNISGCYFAENRGNNGIICLSSGQDTSINDNIFLNNNGDLFYFNSYASSANTDYNWFGNNATNYEDNPNVSGCNVWLFLDATHPDVATILDKSNITFKLYAYDSNEVSEYDNDRLKAVNLTLTPTNGNVNTTRVNLGKPVQFTAESPGSSELTATIENVNYTITLKIADGTTFLDLNGVINGNDNDTIVLDSDYTYNSTFDYNLNGGIVIDRAVTIIGNGHIIDAAGLARIFNIQADNVVINNITFTNGKTNIEGGAICWSGANGNLSGCSFVNNSVKYNGGSIYWNGAAGGFISDCSFVNNSGYNGGALFLDASAGTLVSDCTFANNSANYGGAIFCDSCVGDVVSGCSFVNNTAGIGGAIYWWSSNEGLVHDSSFVNNSVRYYGAAIYWRGNDGNVSGCSFVNNSKYSTIYFYNNENISHNLSINDNIFLNNDDVAIYFVNNDSTSNADYNWFGNNATNYDIAPETNNVEMSTWLFLNATANPDPIPIYDSSDIVFKLYAYTPNGVSEYDNSRLKAVNLTLTPTYGRINATRTILGEPVQYNPDSYGFDKLTAAIENAAYTVTLKITDGTTFSDLNYVINGNDNDTIVLDKDYTYNSTYDANFKNGIVINRPLTIIGNGHTINAIQQAKILNVQADNVTIKNITFIKGASREGGAIYLQGASGNVFDCVFKSNYATFTGGAISAVNSSFNISGCVFENNEAVYSAGAIFWDNGAFNLYDSVFTRNTASNLGGAVAWSSKGTVVSNCVFMSNSVFGLSFGGAIYCVGDDGVVSDCVFIKNRGDYGAAVWSSGARGVVSGSYFVNNTAVMGTIEFRNSAKNNMSINNNIFLNNEGVQIHFVNRDSTSNVDYNWFGNNATNYDTAPITNNAEISTWLFLNATANPDAISIFDSSDIVFKLYAYTPNGVSEYDNSRLKAVNLTVTPTNGRVNTTKTELGKPVHYTSEDAGIGTLTASIENATYTTTLKIIEGTFFELNRTINGNDNDTIILDKDYTYNPTFDYNLNEGIIIDRPVTIIGNGHTLNATGLARIFNIKADNVTIKDITFTNGKIEESGGAIYIENNGTIENCNFVNNNASNLLGQGGAIYFVGVGNVINCNFTDNYAGYGGALYFLTKGDVYGCSFVNNSVLVSGGAICSSKDCKVTYCNFTNNSAFNGAAIFIEDDGIVENCISVNDNASYNGGAIWIGNDGKLENCIFVNDSAGYFGGAVFFDNEGTIKNCNFTNNSVNEDEGGENGGAICIWIDGIVENCTFVDNNAAKYGGAICFYTTGEVINCSFVNNNAAEYAGAIVFYDEGYVKDCIFVNNSARVCGAILFYQNGDLTNCNFTNNTASATAGAVYFNLDGDVTDCIFTNNSGKYGGAIWFVDDNSNVVNSIFDNNSAEEGGAIYFYETGKVSNCNFTNNSADFGGAINFDEDGTVENCNFVNNNATVYGGGIYFYANGEVRNCNFTNNSAVNGGAFVTIKSGEVTDCNFINNSGDYGGAVYLLKGGKLSNSNFTNNSAGLHAGAAYIRENAIVENCSFNGNDASKGGALFINGTAGVTNCNFTDNKVNETQGHGGAILWNGTNGNVSDCSFVNNSGYNGGAICWNGTNGNVSGCSFVNNSATDHGGAILWCGDNGNVSDCSFVNNYVKYYGGSIFWNGTAGGLVSDCSFVNNYGYNGGALFLDAGAGALVSDCTFANNLANWGGAIFCDSCVGDVVSGCSFVNNTAGVGGAVCWWSSNEGLVHDCSFVNNSVRYYGAAIYWRGNDGKVSGCSFVNNSKYSTIYFYNNENISHNLSINDNIFLNNTGVVIYFVNNDSSSNADYNWFGNNATNYDMAPTTNNMEINTWLFLNATANPDPIPITDTSDIIFKLYAYTPNGVSEYDNTLLKAVNLTLTPTNGRVNTNRTNIGEPVQYTPESIGIGTLTASIENATYTVTLINTDGTTFADLNWVINGNNNDTIVLDRDYTYNPTFDYDFKNGIVIDRPVTIIGNGHTLNATGLARIFNIQANDVTIKNITFTNAKNREDGGAVYFENSGTVENCNFTNNTASNGGAVYFFAQGTVTNCNFTNNSAISVDTGGGALFMLSGTVTNCNFTNNTASYDGGAVYFYENGEVTNCNFTKNNARSHGGALYFDNGYCKVTSCIFVNNVVEYSGGALYFYNGGEITNCNFTNNQATGIISWAGAVDMRSGTVTDCNFVNNSAINGDAGAIDIFSGNITNCNFVNNTANTFGGAVELRDYGVVTNCNFTNNSAFGYGGAIDLYSGNITNCNFVNNNATDSGAIQFYEYGEVTNCNFINNSGDFGGAVSFVERGKLSNSNFTNNFGGYGGAVYIKNGIVENCNFNGNNASEGGAIRIIDNVTINNCSFNDNRASKGGAVLIRKDGGVITDCNFINNSATLSGGAIYVHYASDVVVSGSVFVNNSGDNGTIYFDNEEYGSNFTINDNIFLNNDGVAIYFVNSDSTSSADYNWFGNNVTNYDIGPVTNNVEISTWLFLNATANPDAIIILGSFDIVFKLYAYNSSEVSEYDNGRLKAVRLTLTPTNGRVNTTRVELGEPVHYTAEGAGIGTLTASIEDATYTTTLKIIDGTFFELNRTINGNDNDTIVLDKDYGYNSTFDYNLTDGIVIDRPLTIIGNGHTLDATGLARIFNVQADNVTIENITFINAKAERTGGAIYWTGANGVVSDCDFINNSANYAAAIWWDGANGVVSDCDFINNSAYAAGAIWWYAHHGALSSCIFVNNSAESSGGAILWNGANSNVSDCIFVNNTADSAGAIDWSNQYGVISGCSFVNNSANNAGAIRWTTNNGVVTGCSFVNNSAADGIIYFGNKYYGSNLSINDNIFLNNDGVAIYFEEIDSTSNADYNWFGNNATTYDTAPVTNNVEINTWLFLNATANPDAISIFESSEIIFKLYAYNSSEVSEYDNSRLKAVNLTLTSTNGRVNTTKIELGEPVQYTAESGGIGKITATIENTAYTTAKIIVKKADVNLTAQDVTVVYTDESGEFVATLTNTVNGKGLVGANVMVSINGEEYALKTNGKGQVKVSTADLPIGVYTANVSYKGNNRYTPVSTNATVTVTKMDTSISVVYEAASNEVVATITCPTTGKGLITANVIVNLDGEEYALKTDGKGQVKVSTADLKSGKYNVTVTYKGNHKYKPSNATVEVSVKSATILSVPDISVVYGDESGELVATLTNNEGKALVTANVIVTLDGVDYALKTNSKGQVKVSTANLTLGTYKATVSYKGNTKYTPTTTTATVTVNKIGTEITASYDGETNQLVATLTNAETGKGIVLANVIVNLDGIDYALKTNSKGQVKVSTADLAPGIYNATASYNGNGKYASSSTNITINK